MSSSMRNKKRNLNVITTAIAANQPVNIERRANERVANAETELADAVWSEARAKAKAQTLANDLYAEQRKNAALCKTIKRQRYDLLLLVALDVLLVGAYAVSLYR